MELALKEIRESYGMECYEFAEIVGLSENFYRHYEERKELPSKYVYKLWTQLENFPIPYDFFFFTSYTLEINMKFHHMTQTDIAKQLEIANQSTISGYFQENIPMYEKKEYFLKFDPFILPSIMTLTDDEEKYTLGAITTLEAKGNFMLAESRRIQKINRLKKAKAQEVK